MGGNSVEDDSLTLDIRGVVANDGCGLAGKMQNQIFTVKTLQPTVRENHCIFKLPESFKNINDKSYDVPQFVSIGPYHYCGNNGELQIKWQCLEYLLNRKEGDLNRYIESIRPLEKEARECYSEKIMNLETTDDFLQVMVLDGCFILEWLHFTYSTGRGKMVEEHHPLARMDRVILLKIYRDLLLLENQIPLFVLEKLFNTSKMEEGANLSLFSIVVEVFSAILGIRRPEDNHAKTFHVRLHLLDMVRSIFIPPGCEVLNCAREEVPPEYQYRPFDTVPCISKLRRAGIKVKPRKNDSFLEIEFLQRHGVIQMPNIILNDLMCSFLVNCVAFEQCHNISSHHFSIYILFLDCLVNTAKDIEYLCDYRVIENYIETDKEAANFINNLGKGLTFDCDYVNFYVLCNHVNEYYRKKVNRLWTSFIREYYDKPWLWISGLAAIVLLILTCLQTNYTIHPTQHC